MDQILTPDDILARITLPKGAKLHALSVTPPTVASAIANMAPVRQSGAVTAEIKANSQADALQVARDVLRVFDGRRVFIRVAPEADSFHDIECNRWDHVGFVRFFYFNEPGETVARMPPRGLPPSAPWVTKAPL